MSEDQVRLEAEAERATALLQGGHDYYVPLAVAAAIAFHQAHGSTKAIVSRRAGLAKKIAPLARRLSKRFAMWRRRNGRPAFVGWQNAGRAA